MDFYPESVKFDEQMPPLKLWIWDTAGQERFRFNMVGDRLKKSDIYGGAYSAVIIVYDASQRSTFENVKFWQEDLKAYLTQQDAILMLVGNKVDLPDRQVSREEGEEFALANSMMFVEASAKTRQGINLVFGELCQKIVQTPSLTFSLTRRLLVLTNCLSSVDSVKKDDD